MEKLAEVPVLSPTVLEEARAGSEMAWRTIYRDMAPGVLRYLKARRVPDPEDLLGEAFVRVVRNIDRFEGAYEDFRSWVYSIVRNLVIDHARKGSRRPEDLVPTESLAELEGGPDPEEGALRGFDAAEVMTLLEALTPDQRDVILLRFFGQLTSEEVATAIGKRVGAVKTLQRRALAALQREISRKAVSK